MANYFNPTTYNDEGLLPYMVTRYQTDIFSIGSRSMKYAIVESSTQLFDAWLLDMRDFIWFFSYWIKRGEQYNIKTYDFDMENTSLFAPKYDGDATYGYFSVDWYQSEHSIKNLWASETFIGVLEKLGGYSSIIIAFIALLIGNYQSFVFDVQMLKRMYHIEKEEYHFDKIGNPLTGQFGVLMTP